MFRTVLLTCLSFLVLNSSFLFGQQHRIFVQQAGVDPTGVPPEGITIEVVDGNATIVLDAYIEHAPPGERMNGAQVSMPCAASGGSAGSINGLPVTQDDQRPDMCFAGRYCTAGPNIGLPCTSAANATAECGSPGLCPPNSPLAAAEDGMCVDANDFPRAAVTHFFGNPAIVLTAPCYLGTFAYQLSVDAEGSFEIEVPNVPLGVSNNQNDIPIPFITAGATINVPAGRCCNGASCLGEMNSIACANLGGVFSVGQTCADLCCSSYSDCDDDNPCVFETCQSLTCSSHPVRFGDTNGSGGLVDIDDILCINNGFANIANCPNADIIPNCTGNDIIDLDDILGVIVAFGGADPCGCN